MLEVLLRKLLCMLKQRRKERHIMFGKPHNGWTDVLVDNDIDNAEKIIWKVSYLSNVPKIVLEAIRDHYVNRKPQHVELEMEEYGVGSMLIRSDGEIVFINTCYEHPTAYYNHIDNVVDEILKDFDTNIDEWSKFFCGIHNDEEAEIEKEVISTLIAQIKKKKGR